MEARFQINTTKYVERFVEDFRTGVQFPPPPPDTFPACAGKPKPPVRQELAVFNTRNTGRTGRPNTSRRNTVRLPASFHQPLPPKHLPSASALFRCTQAKPSRRRTAAARRDGALRRTSCRNRKPANANGATARPPPLPKHRARRKGRLKDTRIFRAKKTVPQAKGRLKTARSTQTDSAPNALGRLRQTTTAVKHRHAADTPTENPSQTAPQQAKGRLKTAAGSFQTAFCRTKTVHPSSAHPKRKNSSSAIPTKKSWSARAN